jgi:hypothetical protein
MIVMILCGTHVHLRNMQNKSLVRYLMNDGFVYIMVCVAYDFVIS